MARGGSYDYRYGHDRRCRDHSAPFDRGESRCRSESERNLPAFLNSNKVNEVAKPFQSMGLMGERDIHTKVLDVPIPQYNNKDAAHKRLAALGAAAAREVQDHVAAHGLQGTLARMRAQVRALLEAEVAEIDRLVGQILS